MAGKEKRGVRHRVLAVISVSLFLFVGCGGHQNEVKAADGRAPEAKLASAVPERVAFDSLDVDPATGRPVLIHGLLFTPGGVGSRRLPAVVALHGCGGMYSSLKSKRDALSMRHQGMADLLVSEGYIVLFPDSFRSRGLEEICTMEGRSRPVTQRHRQLDTLGALAWLQQRDGVAPDRVAVLGWSHGGSAVLAALNAKDPPVAGRRAGPPYFRAGAAFYPGCSDALNAKNGYSLAAPLELYIGGSDDWTAPGPCVKLADKLGVFAGEPVAITVYPDTYHGFDDPGTRKRLRLEVPNGVNPGQGVTVAPNPAAREDAYAKLRRFLAERIGP
jgi:dienelactone hydrolase